MIDFDQVASGAEAIARRVSAAFRQDLAAIMGSKASPPPASANSFEQALSSRIADLLLEGDGHWRACSGCQESVEGQVSSRDYPFSPVFQCSPGGGCGECGGIGVIWDDTDYSDFADFCQQQERTREAVKAAMVTNLGVIDGQIFGFRRAVDDIMALHDPDPAVAARNG